MKQKLYVVIIEDRHTDVEVCLFTDLGPAIQFARSEANERSVSGNVEELDEQELDDADWLYGATWSVEGDCLRVEEVFVDERLDDGEVEPE